MIKTAVLLTLVLVFAFAAEVEADKAVEFVALLKQALSAKKTRHAKRDESKLTKCSGKTSTIQSLKNLLKERLARKKNVAAKKQKKTSEEPSSDNVVYRNGPAGYGAYTAKPNTSLIGKTIQSGNDRVTLRNGASGWGWYKAGTRDEVESDVENILQFLHWFNTAKKY